MPTELECERRFLVDTTLLPQNYDKKAQHILQGYLINESGITLRVRILVAHNLTLEQESLFESAPITTLLASPGLFTQAIMTMKTEHSYATRNETEFNIPLETGLALLRTTQEIIQKKRSVLMHKKMLWEVDIYAAPLAPLALAEVELAPSQLQDELDLPVWCGTEVTGDDSLSNATLARQVGWMTQSMQ